MAMSKSLSLLEFPESLVRTGVKTPFKQTSALNGASVPAESKMPAGACGETASTANERQDPGFVPPPQGRYSPWAADSRSPQGGDCRVAAAGERTPEQPAGRLRKAHRPQSGSRHHYPPGRRHCAWYRRNLSLRQVPGHRCGPGPRLCRPGPRRYRTEAGSASGRGLRMHRGDLKARQGQGEG